MDWWDAAAVVGWLVGEQKRAAASTVDGDDEKTDGKPKI